MSQPAAQPPRRSLSEAPTSAVPRGTVHGDLSQMAHRPMNGILYFGVLLVAAGIDIATFYQVLALVMKNVPDEVVWLGVVGFTVTALSLAHTIGVRMRERADAGQRPSTSGSAWLVAVIWLFVGITAFIVRLVASQPSVTGGTTIVEEGEQVAAPVAGSDNPLLAALLFLALYLATGTVAAIAGYLRHNTAAKQYRATLRSRSDAAKSAATTIADLTLAQQTKLALDEERRRRAEGWEKAQEEWQAIARRLKQEARLRLASAAQDPSTTDAYFIPPQPAEPPVSGFPASGFPASGVPASAIPASGVPVSAVPTTGPVGPVGPYPPAPAQAYGPGPGDPYAHYGQTVDGDQARPWRLNPERGEGR
jgi:hypothetical protein